MIENDFNQLAQQGYNWIPVSRDIMADLETPLTCYIKLANRPYSYLLESLQGGEQWGQFSIIGLPCKTVIQVRGQIIRVCQNGRLEQEIEQADPLAWIEAYRAQYRVPPNSKMPRFCGGLVGYFGYDTIRYVEPRLGLCQLKDPLDTPDITLLQSDDVAVYDNFTHRLKLITHVDPKQDSAWEKAQQKLDAIEAELRKPLDLPQNPLPSTYSTIETSVSKAEYIHAVNKIKRYIVAGDAMQVVYAPLRLNTSYNADSLQLYRALRHLNPSPYLYFINLDDFQIVGCSPEVLVRVEHGQVTVRPIAGTRPRGKTPQADLALEKELLTDPKELAEHLMLIDLSRNDIGKVCQTNSVKVTETMVIERYSHVMHIASQVQGQLEAGYTSLDALKAALPAGTLSGAPKIRALEIIDELEKYKRGVYGGAVGYYAWQGNLDTAIAIRTAIIKDKKLYVQAGSGIVYDSKPEKEWQECMNKAKAIIKALEIVKSWT